MAWHTKAAVGGDRAQLRGPEIFAYPTVASSGNDARLLWAAPCLSCFFSGKVS
jgi:hypothetical protein